MCARAHKSATGKYSFAPHPDPSKVRPSEYTGRHRHQAGNCTETGPGVFVDESQDPWLVLERVSYPAQFVCDRLTAKTWYRFGHEFINDDLRISRRLCDCVLRKLDGGRMCQL